jgi:hypothetical protein
VVEKSNCGKRSFGKCPSLRLSPRSFLAGRERQSTSKMGLLPGNARGAKRLRAASPSTSLRPLPEGADSHRALDSCTDCRLGFRSPACVSRRAAAGGWSFSLTSMASCLQSPPGISTGNSGGQSHSVAMIPKLYTEANRRIFQFVARPGFGHVRYARGCFLGGGRSMLSRVNCL